MRHGKKVNHLGRKTAHRKAMLANMACSLIEHKRINTTVAKAKALRQFVEPLITKSKAENNQTTEKGTHNRRIVFQNLRDKYAVTELFSAVAEKVGERPGGYTRIIKLGNRLGDNADMAMIELVDFNEIYNADKPKKKTTRRSRRGSGAKAEIAPVPVPTSKEGEKADAEVKADVKAKADTNEKAEPKVKADTKKDVDATAKADTTEKADPTVKSDTKKDVDVTAKADTTEKAEPKADTDKKVATKSKADDDKAAGSDKKTDDSKE